MFFLWITFVWIELHGKENVVYILLSSKETSGQSGPDKKNINFIKTILSGKDEDKKRRQLL